MDDKVFNKDETISLVIISGRSGSGKSVALRVLEDLGFYCIDNLPVMFLGELVKIAPERYPKLAVSIDIRNRPENSESLEQIYLNLRNNPNLDTTIIYIDADDQVLIKRYLETRRLHPLSRKQLSLDEAIVMETKLLSDIAALADLRIDTSTSSVHELATQVTTLILGKPQKELVIVFESFGFKNGIAKDADFVFDARFLPNPFWEENLRSKTGLDAEVIGFFKRYPEVDRYVYGIMATTAGAKPAATALTADNIYTEFLKASESLDDAEVPEMAPLKYKERRRRWRAK